MEKIAGIGGKAHLYTHPAATDEEAEHDVYVHEEEEQRIGLNDDDGEYVLEVHHDKRHVSSAKSATFNLVNNIIGGGVLALPFALRSSGMIVGSVLLTTVGLLCVYSCYLLLEASKYVEEKSYTGLARAVGGKGGAIFADLCNFMFLFGALTGYMIVIGDVLLPFTEWLGPLHHRWFVVGIIATVIVLPLCLLRKIGALAYTSLAALACIVYLVFLVAFRSIQNIAEEGLEKSEDELSLANFAPDIFRSLPIMSFAFTFHPNIFPIFSEMRNPTMSRMRAVVHAAVLVSGLAYLIVGVFGYLTFLEETEGNIFNNYDDDILVEIGKILLAVVIVFSYPIIHYPARIAVDSIVLEVSPNKVPDISIRYIVITACIVALSYLLSIVIPDISFVFGIIGATAGNLIVYTGPGVFYMKLAPGRYTSPRKIGAAILAAVGLVFGVISVLVISIDEIKQLVD